MIKIILLGAPLTGNTTLVEYIQQNYDVPVMDMDQELLKRNDGKWPGNYKELNKKLIKETIEDVLHKDEIIFSCFYFGIEELREVKDKGFEVVQLEVDFETAKKRNKERLKSQPNNDAFKYYDSNIEYQKKIRSKGLVDRIIDGEKSTEEVAKELLAPYL